MGATIKDLVAKNPDIKYWTRQAYLKSKGKRGATDPTAPKVPKSKGHSTLEKLGFLENEDGTPYSIAQITSLRQTAREIFLDFDADKALAPPDVWSGGARLAHREKFYTLMYSKHSDLALCIGDWKADAFAIEEYSHFRSRHAWPKHHPEPDSLKKTKQKRKAKKEETDTDSDKLTSRNSESGSSGVANENTAPSPVEPAVRSPKRGSTAVDLAVARREAKKQKLTVPMVILDDPL